MSQHEPQEDSFCDLKKLVNNYSAATETLFLMSLHQYAQQGIYIIGEGFADMVSNYFMQRLSLCGFRAFSHLHLYDLAAFNNNESIIWKSNLDAALRVKMRSELKTIQRELGITMVFVTHDQEEALLLSDKMAIMEQGKLVQSGAPEEIFRNPATPFVKEFLSLSNLRWEDDGTLVKIIKQGRE
jgi:hypothetical protein